MGPLLYRELTGVEMAYSSADLIWEAELPPENAGEKLRQITGQYYEVYLTDNQTFRIQTLRTSYHREIEQGSIRLCLVLCMVLILVERIWIFEERRATEKKIMGMYTHDFRKVQYGMYIPVVTCIFVGIVLGCVL